MDAYCIYTERCNLSVWVCALCVCLWVGVVCVCVCLCIRKRGGGDGNEWCMWPRSQQRSEWPKQRELVFLWDEEKTLLARFLISLSPCFFPPIATVYICVFAYMSIDIKLFILSMLCKHTWLGIALYIYSEEEKVRQQRFCCQSWCSVLTQDKSNQEKPCILPTW